MLPRASKGVRRVSIFLFLTLSGCSPVTTSFLDPYGPVAASQRDLFFNVIGWMMIVVVPVFVLVPLFAWRYRRTNTASAYRPEWTFSKPLEFVVWGVPVAVVAVLAVLIWTREVALDPYAALPSREPPLEIQVVGLDWKWLFIYPDEGIATVGTLGLPAGRAVRFRLTSDTVMQSFFIPALGSQIYAMAGMVTDLNLKADRAGRLRGRNTQFNGIGFQHQTFSVAVMAPQDFSAWTGRVRSLGRPLDEAAYGQLSRKSTAAEAHEQLGMSGMPKPVLYFSRVTPDLFDQIVGKYRRPAGAGRRTTSGDGQ